MIIIYTTGIFRVISLDSKLTRTVASEYNGDSALSQPAVKFDQLCTGECVRSNVPYSLHHDLT